MANASAPRRDWFRIEAKASTEDESTSADVYIYDEIGERWYGGGVGARSLAQQLDELDVELIRLFLNSPGGAAWDGITIMNALRRHKARVEVTVDGIAASAASIIAMAGDRVTMNRGSEMMIHDASGGAWGPAETMEETAAILHKLSDSLADIYTARAGKDRAHWRALMLAESWYTAEEAVEAGLADDWVDAPSSASSEQAPAARFDLSMFAYSGRSAAPAPRLETPELPVSTEPGGPNRKENVVAYDDLKAGLRERLGVTDAEATDETLLAAYDSERAQKAETPTATLPEGVVAIDSAVLADLQSQAAEGVAARAEQTAVRREGILTQALNDGRITPASRAQWAKLIEDNEESTVALLDSMPKNTAVHVDEVGVLPAEATADDALYATLFSNSKKEA